MCGKNQSWFNSCFCYSVYHFTFFKSWRKCFRNLPQSQHRKFVHDLHFWIMWLLPLYQVHVGSWKLDPHGWSSHIQHGRLEWIIDHCTSFLDLGCITEWSWWLIGWKKPCYYLRAVTVMHWSLHVTPYSLTKYNFHFWYVLVQVFCRLTQLQSYDRLSANLRHLRDTWYLQSRLENTLDRLRPNEIVDPAWAVSQYFPFGHLSTNAC